MFALTVALAVVTGIGFGLSGGAKLIGGAPLEAIRERIGMAPPLWKTVGALELLGGIGLAIGLHGDLPIIGVLAAAGLVALTIGATFYHQRAGDSIRQWLPAVMMGSLAIFSAIARVGSA